MYIVIVNDAGDYHVYGPFPTFAKAQEWSVSFTVVQIPGDMVIVCLRKPLPLNYFESYSPRKEA